jgi:plastocyanin domain-containing protein
MNKKNIFIIIGTVIIVVLIAIFSKSSPKTVKYGESDSQQAISPNVTTENGKQIIEINVKGGYTPRSTVAKANVPTIIRVKTNNAFDCSSSLRIPAINYFKNLEPTATTDIELPNEPDGANVKGVCSMGMYSFSIQFKS